MAARVSLWALPRPRPSPRDSHFTAAYFTANKIATPWASLDVLTISVPGGTVSPPRSARWHIYLWNSKLKSPSPDLGLWGRFAAEKAKIKYVKVHTHNGEKWATDPGTMGSVVLCGALFVWFICRLRDKIGLGFHWQVECVTDCTDYSAHDDYDADHNVSIK